MRTKHAGGRVPEAYISLAEQSGVSLRSVVALAAADRLSALFNSSGMLRRVPDGNPVSARFHLRTLRRRWEAREHTPQRGDVLTFPTTTTAPDGLCGACGAFVGDACLVCPHCSARIAR